MRNQGVTPLGITHQPATWNTITAEMKAIDSELTGAGRELLDKYLSDLRSRVLREAARGRSARLNGDRIGISEIQDAITRIRVSDRLLPRAATDLLRDLVRRSVVVVSGIVIIGALAGLAVISSSLFKNSGYSWAPVALGMLGAFLAMAAALFAFELLRARRWRTENASIIASREFVRFIAAVEENSILLAAKLTHVNPKASMGLSQALAVLTEHDVWSASDISAFLRMLRLRNLIVHEDALALANSELAFASAELRRLDDLLVEASTQDMTSLQS